jgi:hypothetical protein
LAEAARDLAVECAGGISLAGAAAGAVSVAGVAGAGVTGFWADIPGGVVSRPMSSVAYARRSRDAENPNGRKSHSLEYVNAL